MKLSKEEQDLRHEALIRHLNLKKPFWKETLKEIIKYENQLIKNGEVSV